MEKLDQFENRLNQEVKASSYDIKTSSQAILSKYHQQTPAKKPFYQRPFFYVLSLSGAAAVALAITLPLTLRPSNSQDPISTIEEGNEIADDPLPEPQKALAYEITSLYPLFQKQGTSAGLSAFFKNNSTMVSGEDVFAKEVDRYEKMQSQVHEMFRSSFNEVSVQAGSFVGSYGTYENKMNLAGIGDLLYTVNYQSASTKWSHFSGELLGQDGKANRVVGNATTGKNGRQDLTLKILADEENYAVIQRDSTRGTFFFDYSIFVSGRLSYYCSLHRVNASAASRAYPLILLNSYDALSFANENLRIFEQDETTYLIYGSAMNAKITLSYKDGLRTYQFSNFEITKN